MSRAEELERAAQQSAEKRLAAAADMLWSEEAEYLGGTYHNGHGEVAEEQFAGPFCGCDTCVVREVIDAAWPHLKELAAVVESADTPDSNSGPEMGTGSSPVGGTLSDYEEVQRLRRAIADHKVQWVEGINDAFAEDIRRINGRLWNAL